MTALIVTIAVLLLICIRVPIAFALLLPSLGYLTFASSVPTSVAIERMVSSLNGFALLAVPLFILVGNVANNTGLASKIFDVAHSFVGRFRGGLGYVNVFSSLGFSWMSGTVVSDVAVMGSMMAPQMKKRGYKDEFIAGITSAGSLIAPVMPPSVPAIIFGVTSGVSIGALFIAGVIPALIVVLALCLSVWVYARKRDDLRQEAPPAKTILMSAVKALPVAFAPVIVLGGILGGIFTPTEAAAVTVAYLVVISAVFYRSLTLSAVRGALLATAKTTGSVMLLVAGATLYGWVLTVERVPQALGGLILGLTDNPIVFMLATIVLLLIIGCFMDTTAAILILTPVLLPIATSLDIDPVHFGILLIFTLLIGLMTPPVGLVLYVLESVTELRMPAILRGTIPYVLIYIGIALLIMLVPALTTWLPSFMNN
ncbi:TRAP transporter large permease [Paramicrobacterium chengjingii]|uniref:TRAP transporter large permease n=1 Tax=Paramicrobacterium chengjingii TaxID=2769067 RepID=A0ABX6YHT3_9MICO|nr:TRAP transporter large permease [Microbacterium chengjingii]QPZ38322.1 TRAP transporter large permease [Microbacterium chengjingii]